MDSFPSDFNYKTVEEKLYQQVALSEETAKYRKVTFDKCQEAQKGNHEYFRINLKGAQQTVKTILIKDLHERSFTVGYISDIPNQTDIFTTEMGLFSSVANMKDNDFPMGLLSNLATKKLPEGKRHIIKLEKGTFVNADEYIVPLTTNFANKMTSYSA